MNLGENRCWVPLSKTVPYSRPKWAKATSVLRTNRVEKPYPLGRAVHTQTAYTGVPPGVLRTQ